MKHIFWTALACFLFWTYSSYAAKTVYAIAGGDGFWNGDTNWSTTKAGANDTTHPVATDTVYLTDVSPSITVNTAGACAILDCSSQGEFAASLILGAAMTTTGSVTFVAGMTFTPSTYTWNFGCATTTLTPAGKSFYNLNFSATGTVTLAADVTVTNLLSVAAGITATLTTSNIICNGGLTISGVLIGQTITLNGTGTWTGSGALAMQSNVVINTAETITLAATNVRFTAGILTYTAGTVVTTGSTLLLDGASVTLNTVGITWNNVSISRGGAQAISLTSALDINGNLTTNSTGDITIDTSDITVAGNLTVNSTGSIVGTGRTITLDGAGTWSHNSTGTVKTNLTIAGTITIGTNARFGTGILTYTTGTVTTTSSTLNTVGACTLTTNGVTWNNVTIPTGSTVTLGSALQIGGNLSLGATSGVLACGTSDVTLNGNLTNSNGTGGRTGNNTWTMNGTGSTLSGNTNFYNFTINAGKTVHLTSGETYAATGTFTAEGTSGSHIIFDATTPSTHAHFNPTTVGTVNYVDATDIDGSGGTAVAELHGTLLRTTNWTSGDMNSFNALFMAGD